MNISAEQHTTGATPLHEAAEVSQWSALECLVGWGAALNPVDKHGNTPLHLVTTKKSHEAPESPQLHQVNNVTV